MILPGSTIGVFGSGQLGRMFAIEARKMGYRVHTFSPGLSVTSDHRVALSGRLPWATKSTPAISLVTLITLGEKWNRLEETATLY